MAENISISEAAAWLDARDNFLILTHIRPDGDTLGSAGGLAQGLRELGKTAYLLRNTEATPLYSRFAEEYWATDDFIPEYTIAVDTAALDLIPQNAAKYKDRISLCIDHHDTNTMYADFVCLCTYCAACGEIIFAILEHMASRTCGGDAAGAPAKISKKTADCLYVAISTDTGCFCYRNTTANTHRVAASLIESGASSIDLNKLIFRTKRRERISIEGMVLAGMEFLHNGNVAMVTITRDMMESSGANLDDIDDISNIASSIEGVGIGITIREMSSPTDCKISVRTSPPYNASEICKKFGGGGHRAAAGATIKKSAGEVKKDLLAVLEGYDFI